MHVVGKLSQQVPKHLTTLSRPRFLILGNLSFLSLQTSSPQLTSSGEHQSTPTRTCTTPSNLEDQGKSRFRSLIFEMPNLIDAISITDSFYRISYIKDAQTLTGRIDCSEVCDGRFINKNAFCLIHRVTPSVAWHPLSCTLNLGFAMGNLPSVSRRLFCIRHKC